MTPAELVEERLRLEDWLASETRRFGEHCKPIKERLEEIGNKLLEWLNENKLDNFRCDSGTAYKSTLLNVKMDEREKFLDLCLENWDAFGSEALLVAAQKDSIKRWLDEHEGRPPDGVSVSFWTRVNVRRS